MSETHQLDSNLEYDGEPLQAIVGEDAEDVRILGYAVMYTAGSDWNVLVPHDWLANRANELGIPQRVVPNKPRPSSAYKRAIKRLREDVLETVWIEAPRMDTGVPENHRVELRIQEGDGRYVQHLYAEVFFDEEESAQDGGTWVNHHLGYFDYDADWQAVDYIKDDDLEEDNHLHAVWEETVAEVIDLFDEMKTTHIGHGIRQMMYYTTRDYTNNVISLRDGGAVYFFPAGMSEFVDAMSTLYDEISEQFKRGGATMAVRTIPMLDTEDQREWIRERVEKTLEESLDKAIEEAFKEFDEGEAASTVIDMLQQNLGDDENTAETYNALLEAELNLEDMLEQYKAGIDDEDKRDIIDSVLAEADFDR